jgi:tetratricopeptide (TPR) repeat protein
MFMCRYPRPEHPHLALHRVFTRACDDSTVSNRTKTLLTGIACQRAADHATAETLYRSVLASGPHEPQALYLLGLLLLETHRAAEAVGYLQAALSLRPDHAGTLVNLMRALLEDRRPIDALRICETSLAPDAEDAEISFLYGTALNALGLSALAIPHFQHVLTSDPSHAAACLNLGNAYVDLDRLDEAEAHCRRATSMMPTLAEAHASLGFVLTSLGRLDEAKATCQSAIRLRPDFAQAHWNLATAALLAGDFELGFREYEWRKKHDRFRQDFVDLEGPEWDGGDLNSRTLLVHAEQGLGDTIQFARYLPLIARCGGHPVLACDRSLISLLATLPATVVTKDAPLPRYDCWIDQMSLPYRFGTTAASIPLPDSYLRADARRSDEWRASLPRLRRIGLAWHGNPAHSNDRRRSIPAAELKTLFAVPNLHFVNLQVGPCAGEIGLPDLSPLLTDFAETAALIDALDLVVSVDTAVAHVAGALGKPCWLMLPYAPDWRWQLKRDDTPWYSSMRLFRQPDPGDWAAVTGAIIARLRGWNVDA